MCSANVQLAPALSATAAAPVPPDTDLFSQPSHAGPGLPDPGAQLDAPPTIYIFFKAIKQIYTCMHIDQRSSLLALQHFSDVLYFVKQMLIGFWPFCLKYQCKSALCNFCYIFNHTSSFMKFPSCIRSLPAFFTISDLSSCCSIWVRYSSCRLMSCAKSFTSPLSPSPVTRDSDSLSHALWRCQEYLTGPKSYCAVTI